MAVVMMNGDEKKPVFHDFLGMSCGEPAPSPPPPPQPASGGDKSGARLDGEVLLDLSSERRGVNNSEVFHFHGRKNALSRPESSYIFSERKRSITDSAYLYLAKDKMTPILSDYHDYSRNMKMFGKEVVGEPLRRSNDFEMLFSPQPPPNPRPTSLTLNSPSSNRPDTHFSKWEQFIPVKPGRMEHCNRFSQSGTYIRKLVTSCGTKDITSNAVLISQTAADEGSRTGIKSSEILNIINCTTAAGNRSSPDFFPSNSSAKAIQATEPKALNLPSHRRIAPAGRQMTIFYAGQAHVFDDVHPNKADVIMAMAGSSGGAWSTTYGPKSTIDPSTYEARAPSSKETQANSKALCIQGNPVNADEVTRTIVTTQPLNLVPGGHSAGSVDIGPAKSAELPDS